MWPRSAEGWHRQMPRSFTLSKETTRDERNDMKLSSRHPMKRVGLKYCGGCNPAYDREGHVEKVRKIAGSRVEWVSHKAEGFMTLLIVHGCDRECVLQETDRPAGVRIVSIRNERRTPEELVSLLLKQGESK